MTQPTPFTLRVLRGNPSKRPLRPEVTPARGDVCPEPPAFLRGYASDEWHRTAPELHPLGLLTVLDVMPFAIYCVAYSRFRTAAEKIAADDARIESGLVLKAGERSAWLQIEANAAREMLRVASQFGLTPVARSRLAAAGASLWHAEDEDGGDALPNEASAKGCHRDGTPRARLQSHPGDEHHGHPAAHGRNPSIVKAANSNSRLCGNTF
jgi:P27 family predicted phage terminase small subunit